ncbi:Hypothetical predicted protein [Marmota monax]|uniref:Ig-like domain-containing protein n=1 Tax=Marmota monax TaxID=9995 RepID=A0A5E4A3Z0_MARMO|nr:Hypothetical predicted protein [Marmota monax]
MAVLPNSLPKCLLIIVLLLLTQLDSGPAHSLTGHFEVLGPQEPILAFVGEDSELRWFRNTFLPAVLVLQDRQEQEGEQMPEYRGTIHRIRTSDEGVYGCSSRDKQAQGEAFVNLKVAALGSEPHITMEVQESGEVWLECTSVGWYPEPQVQWRSSKGEEFPTTSESRSPDEEGLFTVAASVTLRDSSMDSVSCCIRNLLLGQEKEPRGSLTWHLPRCDFLVELPTFPPWVVQSLLPKYGRLSVVGAFDPQHAKNKSQHSSTPRIPSVYVGKETQGPRGHFTVSSSGLPLSWRAILKT